MKLTSSSPPPFFLSFLPPPKQLALLSLYFFRSAAIAVYVLCGLFTDNYVLSVSPPPHHHPSSLPSSSPLPPSPSFLSMLTSCLFLDSSLISSQIVMVVILLSMDFWNTRVRPSRELPLCRSSRRADPFLFFQQNVAGRTLVGLRYWNQVDEDGESSWVFESRDVSPTALHPARISPRLFAVSVSHLVSSYLTRGSPLVTPTSPPFPPTPLIPSSSGPLSTRTPSVGLSCSSFRY